MDGGKRPDRNRGVIVALVAVAIGAFGAGAGRCEVRLGTLGAVKAAEKALDDKTVESRGASCTDAQLTRLEQTMSSTLDASAVSDFTLLLETADGRSYAHSKGSSSGSTPYESASTSKLVASVVILSLVDRGFLTLDTKASDLISWWTTSPANPISEVTLRHLLSFTSGASTEPVMQMGLCLSLLSFEGCVQQIYNLNVGNNIPPGSEFYYASTHLQIAGLMALKARQSQPDGVAYSSWTHVFEEFKVRTGLFPDSNFDVPFSSNPRLAGGMTWTGEDYMGFLRALYRGQVLSAPLRSELWSNQRGSAAVGLSPLVSELGEDWPYALGNWVECEPGTSCASAGRNSSPGAFGAYPFIDFGSGYFGILARRDVAGSFPEGVELFRTVQGAADDWARKSCGE